LPILTKRNAVAARVSVGLLLIQGVERRTLQNEGLAAFCFRIFFAAGCRDANLRQQGGAANGPAFLSGFVCGPCGGQFRIVVQSLFVNFQQRGAMRQAAGQKQAGSACRRKKKFHRGGILKRESQSDKDGLGVKEKVGPSVSYSFANRRVGAPDLPLNTVKSPAAC